MKKRILAILLATSMVLSLTACGGEEKSSTDEAAQEEQGIEVDENLLTVEITVPAEYMGETTQEELDAEVTDGIKSITLNEDGSATYVMTKKAHKDMMEKMSEEFDTEFSKMIGSEEYPNITAIEANDDFTSFTITTKSQELDFNESFSVLGFYMYGAIYNAFNGTTVENIHVEYVNADSGEVISASDSKDLAEESTEAE